MRGEELDDRGRMRERLAALEAELPRARDAVSALRAECDARRERVAQLEQRLARVDLTERQRRGRAKLVMGFFLLPFAALAGLLSGMFASIPLLLAGVAFFDGGGEASVTALMSTLMAIGALSAVTLAVRSLRRS